MNKEELLTTIRDLSDKVAQLTDITHDGKTFLELKPRLEKLITFYRYQLENGDTDLVSQNTQESLKNHFTSLLELVNRLPGEPFLLNDIANTAESLRSYIPQFSVVTYELNSFRDQLDGIKEKRREAENVLKEVRRHTEATKKTADRTLRDATGLLQTISAGTLTKQIDEELSSLWNIALFMIYIGMLTATGNWLVRYANEVKAALSSPAGFDFEALIVSWLAKLPFVILFVFAAVLLRARVRYIDELKYRRSVAASLEKQVDIVLNKAKELGKNEGDKVRLLAVEILADVIKKFSASPTTSSEQELKLDTKLVGVAFKDTNKD